MKPSRARHLLLAGLMVGMFTATGCQAQSPDPAASQPAASVAAAPVAPAAIEGIAPADAAKLMSTQADLQVLDVRTPEEVAGGVIAAGAKTINWFDADFATRAETSLDKAKPVLVYCKAGGRSSKAADILSQKGFTKIYNLNGGITQWSAEGHPLQKQ